MEDIMEINPYVFRKYDIRGIVGTELTEDFSYALAHAITSSLKEESSKRELRLTVGYDVRESSPILKSALINGLLDAGVDVIELGCCPTPLLYFSLYALNVDGGIMITGSHNPKEYNGFKICYGKDTIHGEQIERIKDRMEKGQFTKSDKRGVLKRHNIIADYLKRMSDEFGYLRDMKPLRVVVDAGNATASLVAPELYKMMGCDVIPLFCEIDGTFPNHHPDPTIEENLKSLIERVKNEKANIGIAFDGDADRIGVIDDKGKIIWGDELMILFARSILKEVPKGVFVSEVKCSQIMYDEIERMGGRPIMWKTGHSLIKEKMKESSALLAGEMSGHIFFSHRYYGYDDAIYAGARLIEILKKEEKPLSELLSKLPKTFKTPEIRIDCPDEKKFSIIKRLSKVYRERMSDDPAFGIKRIIDIDGIRVVFKDGWGLIRPSNTQPVLVMRFE
ncbi:MAG: phosphomannomutase/phosphoglucomutase, partial [Nitrospirae bacterium]